MNKLLIGVAAALATAAISACASSSSDTWTAYISPGPYQGYTCQQISAEAARVSSRGAEVAGVQDKRQIINTVSSMAIGAVFWPAVIPFALATSFDEDEAQEAAELARLKREYEALEKIAIEKNCNVQFRSS
jgi:hypothetical protein